MDVVAVAATLARTGAVLVGRRVGALRPLRSGRRDGGAVVVAPLAVALVRLRMMLLAVMAQAKMCRRRVDAPCGEDDQASYQKRSGQARSHRRTYPFLQVVCGSDSDVAYPSDAA